jgi:hypothetical protein
MACTLCTFDPPCRSRQEMARRHGTPAQFQRAARAAVGEISVAEYETAVSIYQAAWDCAQDEWDLTPNPGDDPK